MAAITDDFSGSKAAIFIGDRLLTTLRDNRADIPCPNMWDLVGGGRDNDETPWQTLRREAAEEVALDVDQADVLWERRYTAAHSVGWVMFYVVHFPPGTEAEIVFGDEGQCWKLVDLQSYLEMDDAVPSLPPRLQDWLSETGGLVPVAD